MAEQTIRISAGAIEYTWLTTVTEATGKDISGDTVLIGLGSYDDPGDLAAPDVTTHPTTSSVTAQMLIGDDPKPDAGTYYVWVKITDSPEVVPIRGARLTIA